MRFIYCLLVVILLACTSDLNPQTVVAIQPLGQYDTELTSIIEKAIKKYYGVKVTVLKAKPIPKSHFVNVKSPRYRADSIIHYLKETRPASADYVLGFTDVDVSVTKTDDFGRIKEPIERYKDWGVMGLAYLSGRSCVVSTFRLRSNGKLLNERVTKVTLHELGHMLGLPHCDNEKCFMADAVESIKTIDNARLDLCETCKKKIGMLK
ncbi:matrixin family metalloprotease [Cytophagaceae bacterium YF14B1]|uniref:Matrixin family metalloprotease n=1 Tax=Xanthocytophaga flava TaxID=3048013 RepID=A0AAE3QTS1_9BACT|nr:matrixin family metalloprotease [Xanthocytophaga flavus]MDJ1485322.1 matrixin family metalloprotease [Xanthocytophaga flavus]